MLTGLPCESSQPDQLTFAAFRHGHRLIALDIRDVLFRF
jgi:hypothetical protein